MTQPIILSSGQIRQWGERRAPLRRTKAYAFSVDMTFLVDAAWGRAPDKRSLDPEAELRIDSDACRFVAQGSSGPHSPFLDKSGLYHFQDEVLVKSADGGVRDVPHGAPIVRAVVFGTESPAGGVDLYARVLANWQERTCLSFEVKGVLYPCGDLLRFWSASDAHARCDTIPSAVTVQTETDSSTFRWLVRNQLFGWGHLSVVHEERRRFARFTYDLYSMGG